MKTSFSLIWKKASLLRASNYRIALSKETSVSTGVPEALDPLVVQTKI